MYLCEYQKEEKKKKEIKKVPIVKEDKKINFFDFILNLFGIA